MYDDRSMPLAANTRLGPYEIVSPLGAGGMGEVFRARDTRLDRTVAIKICTGRFTERFEREAKAISSLNHPHICALYDIGREGTVEFLVMEYLEGESLEARLRKGPLPIEEALQIAIQVASALDAAHRRGMVHRDLKPGNVMLTKGVWRRGGASSAISSLQWIDRSGKKLGVVGEPAEYSNPVLSPDDSKLAVCIRDPQIRTRDIWIFDMVRGTRTRLTFDPAEDVNPVWSPDGTRIAFTSDRAGQRNIYWKAADGSGSEELLLGGKDGQENVEDWSKDGKYLMYNLTLAGVTHLYVLPLADRKPVPFLNSQFRAEEGQFSPNSRWVAYSSTESARAEVYVQAIAR